MTAVTDSDPIADAIELAKRHRLSIVAVQQKTGDRYVPAWVVYRQAQVRGERGTRLGRRQDPAELLRFVKQLAGVA